MLEIGRSLRQAVAAYSGRGVLVHVQGQEVPLRWSPEQGYFSPEFDVEAEQAAALLTDTPCHLSDLVAELNRTPAAGAGEANHRLLEIAAAAERARGFILGGTSDPRLMDDQALWLLLGRDPEVRVRRLAARWMSGPRPLFEELSHGEDTGLLKQLAANHHCPPRLLERLYLEGEADLARVVADNPSATRELLSTMCGDPDEAVRQRAYARFSGILEFEERYGLPE